MIISVPVKSVSTSGNINGEKKLIPSPYFALVIGMLVIELQL